MFSHLISRWRAEPVTVAIIAIGLAVALSLAIAYTAEYGFALLPCDLCLLQRKPFFASLGLVALAAVFRKPLQRKMILGLIGVVLLGNSGLALYHTGVEQKWWQGPTECSGGEMPTGGSLDEMRAQIMAAPLIRCDVPAWEFHGITMASANIFFCLALAIFAFWSVYAATPPRR